MAATIASVKNSRALAQSQPTHRSSLLLALVLTTVSGCAALGHELLWTRRLIDLLGASTESAARVFGCFFLGLALGAVFAARKSQTIQRPWRFVAISETAVVLLSVPVLLLPQWTGSIWPLIGPQRLLGWEGAAVKFAISFLVVVPPALAIGLVFPVLAKAATSGPANRQKQSLWLYAANTAGGVVGLLLASLVALEWWGVTGTMLAMMTANLAVAAFCWHADRRAGDVTPTTGQRRRVPFVEAPPFGLLASAAFISGFGILALEVVFFQLFQLSAIISLPVTTAMLASVLLPLAVISLAVPLLAKAVKSPERLLSLSLLGAALGIALTPVLFMSESVQRLIVRPDATLGVAVLKLIEASLLSAGPGVLLAGMVFPLVLYLGQQNSESIARPVGWLLFWNGLGGLLGAEAAYRWVLPAFGVHQGMGAIALFYAVTAVVLAVLISRRFSVEAGLSLAGCGFVAAVCVIKLSSLPQINPNFGLRPLSISNGRDGAIAVVEQDSFGRGILIQNQYLLGSTAAAHEQARQALLPMLLHPAPHRIAFIGLATGSTAAAALQDKDATQITAIEISKPVVNAAQLYFGSVNSGLFTDPRALVAVEDGRTYLAACHEAFDIVVGDLFLPWQPGAGRLYSVEHCEVVRAALAPHGIFCQWLPMHQLTELQLDLCIATFQKVFGNVEFFRGNLDTVHPLLGLVAWKDGDLDWRVITNRCETFGKNKLSDPLLRHPEGLALLCLGRAGAPSPETPINTLGNPLLEMSAARERLTGSPARKYLTHERWLKFSQEQIESSVNADLASSSLRSLETVGQQAACAQLFRERGQKIPANLLHSLREQRLTTLLADTVADWSAWPGLMSVWNRK